MPSVKIATTVAFMLRALLLPGIFFVGGVALAAPECGKLSTRAGNVGYCIARTDGDNPDVLYYFHGSTFTMKDVREPERLFPSYLDEHWRNLHRSPPSVITVSWGDRWVLKDEKLTAFQMEIIPALEDKLPHVAGRRRLILGTSMGGLSAFIAWAHLPQLFNAVAFQCPAFTQASPVASRLVKKRLARQWPGNLRDNLSALNLLSEIFRPSFSSSEEWLRYQPPRVMGALAGQALPPAYLVFNTKDPFGLNGAPEIGAAGHQIIYERVAGSHCEGVFTAGLANFLSDRSIGVSATKKP